MTSQTSTPVRIRAREPFFPAPEPDDRSTYAHRQLIGGLGLTLPALLWVIAGLRPTDGFPAWKVLDSVSAYYYTGATAAFVGVLIALAVFLFTYRGYDNEHGWRDRLTAIVAGCAAVLVAFFPTDPDPFPGPSWWKPPTGTIHVVSATVLFCAFIFFSLFLFPKSKVKPGEPLPRDKRVRNRIYVTCGVAIAVCIVWAGIANHIKDPIFLPETLMLVFFAVSWLAKGRADRTAAAVYRRSRKAIKRRVAPSHAV